MWKKKRKRERKHKDALTQIFATFLVDFFFPFSLVYFCFTLALTSVSANSCFSHAWACTLWLGCRLHISIEICFGVDSSHLVHSVSYSHLTRTHTGNLFNAIVSATNESATLFGWFHSVALCATHSTVTIVIFVSLPFSLLVSYFFHFD